jgi:excisionase family DNA binding protein
MRHTADEESPSPLLLTIPQAAKRLGLGRNKVYDLIREGLPVLHIGRAARIPAKALEEFIEQRLQSGVR